MAEYNSHNRLRLRHQLQRMARLVSGHLTFSERRFRPAVPPLAFRFRVDFVCKRSESQQGAQSGRTEIASFACAANRQPQSIQELRCNAARKADIGRDRSEVRGVYDRVADNAAVQLKEERNCASAAWTTKQYRTSRAMRFKHGPEFSLGDPESRSVQPSNFGVNYLENPE